MLENIPEGLGHALRGVRAGYEKIVSEDEAFAGLPETIELTSAAFSDGGAIPARFTEDGDKVSPPLQWNGVPADAAGLVLIVEDPDAPAPEPLVHLLVWDLPVDRGFVGEAEFVSPGSPGRNGRSAALGRNSFLHAAYLPPDPPPGHGPHLYVFQLFAVDHRLSFEHPPRRSALVDAMRGRVRARGLLIGTYERT